MDGIFEKATRRKLRFPSEVGELAVEQLWDLPMKAKSHRPSLDSTAQMIHTELQALPETSFVDDRPDPRKAELELQLEVVKRVIEVKKAEHAAADQEAQNAERRKRLLAVLARKEEDELVGMSRAEIEAEIANLAA